MPLEQEPALASCVCVRADLRMSVHNLPGGVSSQGWTSAIGTAGVARSEPSEPPSVYGFVFRNMISVAENLVVKDGISSFRCRYSVDDRLPYTRFANLRDNTFGRRNSGSDRCLIVLP